VGVGTSRAGRAIAHPTAANGGEALATPLIQPFTDRGL
jgi:hypothetical protein